MITLTTKCPLCHTLFSVSATELQRRKGLIRCVHCAHIFDGYEAVVNEDTPTIDLEWSPATSPNANTKEPTVDPSPQGMAQEPSVYLENKPFKRVEPVIDLDNINDGQANKPDSIQKIHSAKRRPYRIRPTAASPAQTAENTEPSINLQSIDADSDQTDEQVADEGVHLAIHDVLAAAADATSDTADTNTTTVYAEPRYSPQGGVHRHAWKQFLWKVLLLLLVILAVGQAFYVFRAQIALYAPFTRPALQAFCVQIGCEVPYLRAIQAIRISQSRLSVEEPTVQSSTSDELSPRVISDLSTAKEQVYPYLLEIGMQNTASLPQQWPTLLVTFSDVSATVLARIEITPEQYLSNGQFKGPFLPGQMIHIRMAVESKDMKINGFKIDKFFS